MVEVAKLMVQGSLLVWVRKIISGKEAISLLDNQDAI